MAVGALVRNQTVAVTVALVWVLTVERRFGETLAAGALADWLPSALGSGLVHIGPGAPPAWAAAAALAAYVACFAALATRFVVSRDVT